MARRTRPKPAPAGPVARPYLQSPPRIAVILGSFALLAVPLAALELIRPLGWFGFALSSTYIVVLGGTHFIITLGVYLHGANLRYFASSPGRVAVYFLAPAAILVAFFAIGFYGLNTVGNNPSAAFLFYVFAFTLIVKALDYLHVVRQSFGVLQLFKSEAAGGFPRWARRADNSFFLSMAALQELTFIGAIRSGNPLFQLTPISAALVAVAGVCFAGVMGGFVAARGRARAGTLRVPFAYFLLQGASAVLPVWNVLLYPASLAMHYVEYHVIMFPRLFAFAPDPSSRADAVAGWMRRHKAVFYGALVVLAFFLSRDNLWPVVSARVSSARWLWFLFNILNGMFVTHYFIEAFIWKFRAPYYRASLGPLYFPPATRAATTRVAV